ncbi:hypothetical protein H9P43_002812 [Blastocladiella emersonii ATCC 22665]|nr:hypothetical protein H9P43_002812 [Blastocladiella emersonii ATCC 22665]
MKTAPSAPLITKNALSVAQGKKTLGGRCARIAADVHLASAATRLVVVTTAAAPLKTVAAVITSVESVQSAASTKPKAKQPKQGASPSLKLVKSAVSTNKSLPKKDKEGKLVAGAVLDKKNEVRRSKRDQKDSLAVAPRARRAPECLPRQECTALRGPHSVGRREKTASPARRNLASSNASTTTEHPQVHRLPVPEAQHHVRHLARPARLFIRALGLHAGLRADHDGILLAAAWPVYLFFDTVKTCTEKRGHVVVWSDAGEWGLGTFQCIPARGAVQHVVDGGQDGAAAQSIHDTLGAAEVHLDRIDNELAKPQRRVDDSVQSEDPDAASSREVDLKLGASLEDLDPSGRRATWRELEDKCATSGTCTRARILEYEIREVIDLLNSHAGSEFRRS